MQEMLLKPAIVEKTGMSAATEKIVYGQVNNQEVIDSMLGVITKKEHVKPTKNHTDEITLSVPVGEASTVPSASISASTDSFGLVSKPDPNPAYFDGPPPLSEPADVPSSTRVPAYISALPDISSSDSSANSACATSPSPDQNTISDLPAKDSLCDATTATVSASSLPPPTDPASNVQTLAVTTAKMFDPMYILGNCNTPFPAPSSTAVSAIPSAMDITSSTCTYLAESLSTGPDAAKISDAVLFKKPTAVNTAIVAAVPPSTRVTNIPVPISSNAATETAPDVYPPAMANSPIVSIPNSTLFPNASSETIDLEKDYFANTERITETPAVTASGTSLRTVSEAFLYAPPHVPVVETSNDHSETDIITDINHDIVTKAALEKVHAAANEKTPKKVVDATSRKTESLLAPFAVNQAPETPSAESSPNGAAVEYLLKIDPEEVSETIPITVHNTASSIDTFSVRNSSKASGTVPDAATKTASYFGLASTSEVNDPIVPLVWELSLTNPAFPNSEQSDQKCQTNGQSYMHDEMSTKNGNDEERKELSQNEDSPPPREDGGSEGEPQSGPSTLRRRSSKNSQKNKKRRRSKIYNF
jgi:hypothetical protein